MVNLLEKNIKIKIITKSEVVFSSHIFLEKHSKTSYKLLNHLILIMIQFTELFFVSIVSQTKRTILFNCLKFWKTSLLNGSWESKRAKINRC
jgi:hypothetical protein